jgi:hypothetical protein
MHKPPQYDGPTVLVSPIHIGKLFQNGLPSTPASCDQKYSRTISASIAHLNPVERQRGVSLHDATLTVQLPAKAVAVATTKLGLCMIAAPTLRPQFFSPSTGPSYYPIQH